MQTSPCKLDQMKTCKSACLRTCRFSNPDASIVIPAFNEEASMPQTLGTLAASISHSKKRVEVIVVDNGSADRTAKIAEAAGATVVREESPGVAAARNCGLQAAKGEIVLTTDADMISFPDTWVDAHLRHYADPEVVGVAGRHRFDRLHPLYHLYKCGAGIIQVSTACLHALRLSSNNPRHAQRGINASYRREAAQQIGYAAGVNSGEDFLMSASLSKVGTVVWDGSETITVVTNGRRFQSVEVIGREVFEQVRLLLSGKLYGNHQRDFANIRQQQ